MQNPYAPPASSSSASSRPLGTKLQVVGRSCATCDKRLATADDGVGCIACERTYHHRCLTEPDRCPKCGQSMSLLERTAAEAEASAERESVRRGRVLVWAALAPYALLEVVAICIELSHGGSEVLGAVVRLAIEGALVWKTVTGHVAARRVLAFLFVAAFAVSLLFASGATGIKAVFLVGNLIASVFAFWVFAFSRNAKGYLDAGSKQGSVVRD